ncbi:MAG: FAD binding domain-containing protein [Polyangiales bacterium]
MTLRFVLNGEPAHADDAEPTMSLLGWLRASGRTGTKEGCAEGECGACAVALVRRDAEGRVYYESVNSCLVPLGSVAGQQVVSVEGVAQGDGTLHPVQAALVEHGGSQCGYCTPGFVVSMFAEYHRPGRETFDLDAIGGNLCRCTGYRPIIEAARLLPAARADDARTPRAPIDEAREVQTMEARFLRPRTLDALFACMTAHPGAALVAGGTDLMVGVNQHGARHDRLIALEGIDALHTIAWAPEALTIGAGVTLSLLAQHLARQPQAVPLLAQLLPLFSSRLIRNRATLGGNLATASPIGDAAPCLLALDAELVLARADATRRVPLSAFFLDYRRTALSSGEIILAVRVPLPAPPIARFYKVSKRVLDDISIVACAFALALDENGRIAHLSIGCGGIAATPCLAEEASARALGQPLDDATLHRVRPALEALGTPMSDHRGSAAYRRAMLGRLLEKFWHEARAQRDQERT